MALLAMISSPNAPLITEPVDSTMIEQHAEDGVDAGEDVGPDDVGDAACRAGRHVVGLAVGDPLGDLGIGQAG